MTAEQSPASIVRSRRRFLKSSLAAGAVTMADRAFAAAQESTAAQPTAFEFDEVTVASLQQRMNAGEITARAVAEKYLSRIEAMDRQGPSLNSIIELNPDALKIAGDLDQERRDKRQRGPLHGIPVLIKDNIATSDRLTTTAGSLAMAGWIAPRDAFVVQKLRAAGALILGKTNLSEWANIRSSHSTSGWSARGGLTRNPYALDRNPCGSSSGSAVAVAANLCALAVGTETDGSIVCPANANGIVGIKPTVGLVSRSGIIPIAHSQDTAGPMARTVADAALLLSVMAGFDAADGLTAPMRGKAPLDYTRFLDPHGLRGARIGVVRKYFGFNDRVDQLMNEAIAQIKRLGATVVDEVEVPGIGQFDESELEVLLFEFKADLNAYLGAPDARAPVRSLKEVIEFNEKHREQEMPYFGQDLFLKAEAKGPLTSKEYREALKKNLLLSRTQGIDGVMDKLKLEALIAPAGGPAWKTDLVNGDHFGGSSSSLAAVAGYPNITVPLGYVFGLPVGISFFGKAWSEPTLIKFAYAFEQATRFRKAPAFALTADAPVLPRS